MRKITKEMSVMGILERRILTHESPYFLEKKPNGEYRLLVNCREMNEMIEKITDRVPRYERIWEELRDAVYCVTLDSDQGFFSNALT